MHYQIFLPLEHIEGEILLEKQLAKVGLSDLIEGACSVPSEGPNGKTGILVGWPNPRANRHCYSDKEQTWEPAQPDGDLQEGRYFVGYWNDSPPTQADLIRSQIVRGLTVELGNGERWLAPNMSDLPSDAVLIGGEWLMQVQPRFCGLYVEHLEWKSKFATNDEFMYADAIEFANQAFQLNYRLPREVVSHLRLFTKKSLIYSHYAFHGVDASAMEGAA